MKVLLFGAGASKSAGYPLARALMPTIERDVHESENPSLPAAWNRWKDVREKAPEPLRLLLEDRNPEVALSVLDLCQTSESSSNHKWLSEASGAKSQLIECLVSYFEWKHYEDWDSPERRKYLRAELERLHPGDVVITLNWDTTAERTLLEIGRWSPRDGYGFLKKLCCDNLLSLSDSLPEKLSRPSEIFVLKLHGSVGWYLAGAELYYGHDLLNFFPDMEQVYDPVERKAHQPGLPPDNHSPVIAYPSFLKKLNTPPMPEIWGLADDALRCAHEVEIWGYSLPESDSAVRTLLNPLRFRLERGEIQVSVHEPFCKEVRHRWQQFLGPKARVDERSLGG